MSTKLTCKFHNAVPVRIAHPAVAEFGVGAGSLDHGPEQQGATESTIRDQCHRRDRAVEQRPRREDQVLRRTYPECFTAKL